MANTSNTARTGIYLPEDLKEWFDSESKKGSMKTNSLIVRAMEEFRERTINNDEEQVDEWADAVRSLINERLKDFNLI